MSVPSKKRRLGSLIPRVLRNWYTRGQRDRFESRLNDAARLIIASDARGELRTDPGPERANALAVQWLCRAQDESASADGGVARHYSLVNGWSPSYPEATGFIVPTLLTEAALTNDKHLQARVRRMLDWFVAIQHEGGGFQGGMIDAEPNVPVTFNTGQILLGLCAGAAEFGEPGYRESLRRAADWLVQTQDPDGAWRRHPTPFAQPGEKAYETHVSWGLFEAERVLPGRGYGAAGLRQVEWALTKQQPNGWFEDCCLDGPAAPLTHTLGYVLRGVLEAYRLSGDEKLLRAAERTGRALLGVIQPSGHLAGCYDRDWQPAAPWVCLTGSVQVAKCWFMLAEYTGDQAYIAAARSANSFVRRTMTPEGDPGVVGGVRGSWPISGAYGRYQFLCWAAKFMIDANRAELAVKR
jgi:hypothetical protein